MLRYTKGRQPADLTELQARPRSAYGELLGKEKDPIREALVHDQGKLCAYCQRRISDEIDPKTKLPSMKIEHWEAQSDPETDSLQWRHLLGVCHGGSPGAPGTAPGPVELHCDASRGNQPLHLHPVEGLGLDPREHLRYTHEGEVRSRDPRATQDIRALNLNAPLLKRARVDVYDELTARFKQFGYTKTGFRRLRGHYVIVPGKDAPEHPEFARHHIDKRLRRAGGQ